MFDIFVVAVHERYKVFFVELLNDYALSVIEVVNKWCIFDYELPLGGALFAEVVSKSLLVCLCELVLCVSGIYNSFSNSSIGGSNFFRCSSISAEVL